MSDSVPTSSGGFFREHRWFLLLLLLYALFATLWLDHYPRVWVDEPWEATTGYTLVTEGKLHNPVLENYDAFDRILLQPRLFLSIAVAPAFWLFGFGPIQGRIVSGIFGGLLLIAVYRTTTAAVSRRAALLAVWFITIETMIFISYRTIRPEIYLAAFEMVILALFFRGLRSRRPGHFLAAGILSGVALWTHPNALLLVIGLAAVFIIEEKRRLFTSRSGWSFAAGAVLGLLPYLLYVVVNDAHDSFATFFVQLDNRTDVLVKGGWLSTSFGGEWKRVVEYAQFPDRVLLIPLYLLGWIFSFSSKRKEIRYLGLIVGIQAVFSFLLISNKTILYSSTILPLLCVLLAELADRTLGGKELLSARVKKALTKGHVMQTVALAGVLLFSANQLAGDATLLWRQRDCSYEQTIAELREVIPPESRVWGSMAFLFGFYQQPYRTQYTRFHELENFKPEYLITGDREVWGKDSWRDVREAAEKLAATRGTLVKEFPETPYGALRVYRLRW
ncbi:MAG TPA: glycosyltransferase family 39 protein [Bacteroidota bacterium]|nr:glycosyltransferase family 39 protein [Bacteroidota bacterium]